MPLPLPDLDDRTFDQLMEESRRYLERAAPGWTDLSPGDPGILLLELYAHLTETMIYRLNRLPEKAYIAFLNLLGVKLAPPAAARATLIFQREKPGEMPLEIPRGTRVTANRSGTEEEPPVFVTTRDATIAAGAKEVRVPAYHCEVVEGELIGIGTGLPGLSVHLLAPPVIAPTGDELDLSVGVEAIPEELSERVPAIKYQEKVFRIWRERPNFTNLGADRHVYVADRMTGTITFGPAARLRTDGETLEEAARPLAEVPPAGREIRAWYRRGGGTAGNSPANTLTVLKDPIPGVRVTNKEPASGGQAAETLENALIRGPMELHTLQRAITARDFEAAAQSSAGGAVARVKAVTSRDVWEHAEPGTVEVILVPNVPEEVRSATRLTVDLLHQYEKEDAKEQIQQYLDERRPLGTTCRVLWANYKTVQVKANIVVGRHEDRAAVEVRVLDRLYRTISPLPSAHRTTGWPFGAALRASDIYNIALSEPGVRWVEGIVKFTVAEVPGRDVRSIAADYFQAQTWYTGSDDTLYRSMNDGSGWEVVRRFPGEEVQLVEPHRNMAGFVAVLTTRQAADQKVARVYVSRDCGETWPEDWKFTYDIDDLAWVDRNGTPMLLLASEKGLFEQRPGSEPVQLVVEDETPGLGFCAVAAVEEVRGITSVAVAAREMKGVYLSDDGGRSYRSIDLEGENVRRLAIQRDATRAYLWAGVFSEGTDEKGKGAFRWALTGIKEQDPPEGWQPFAQGWEGGSCQAIAFLGSHVLAATHRAGILWLAGGKPGWRKPEIDCGLPLRETEKIFERVNTVATNPHGTLILAGGPEGAFRGNSPDKPYDKVSRKELEDKVTLPGNWLFVSGEHEVSVVSEDETS